jgi:hypothetical protein
MSYVLLSKIGCSDPSNPYKHLDVGIETSFLNPQSISTSGKTGSASTGSVSEVMQGFFAEQVSKHGWLAVHEKYYHSLHSTSFPSSFLPCSISTDSFHTANNQTIQHFNMGQLYLANSLAMTFLTFPQSALARELLNIHDPDSHSALVFGDKLALPNGIKNENDFINLTKKYELMITHAINQAYRYKFNNGPCGKILNFICKVLDRKYPGWTKSNSITAKWWLSQK